MNSIAMDLEKFVSATTATKVDSITKSAKKKKLFELFTVRANAFDGN